MCVVKEHLTNRGGLHRNTSGRAWISRREEGISPEYQNDLAGVLSERRRVKRMAVESSNG
jgi:hypothetical protein